jgi:hypothetical protein
MEFDSAILSSGVCQPKGGAYFKTSSVSAGAIMLRCALYDSVQLQGFLCFALIEPFCTYCAQVNYVISGNGFHARLLGCGMQDALEPKISAVRAMSL